MPWLLDLCRRLCNVAECFQSLKFGRLGDLRTTTFPVGGNRPWPTIAVRFAGHASIPRMPKLFAQSIALTVAGQRVLSCPPPLHRHDNCRLIFNDGLQPIAPQIERRAFFAFKTVPDVMDEGDASLGH
jgi:hypothetical protein